MTAMRVPLHCPHCLKSSYRPLRFVQAKSSFVCDHCREVVPIDKAEVSRTLVRLATAAGAGLELKARSRIARPGPGATRSERSHAL
jgi:hypothetical protein